MPMPKNGTYWFTCEPPHPPLLLRRTIDKDGVHDEAFRGGEWKATHLIVAWMAGQEDDVDTVTLDRAKTLAPDAFL